MELIGKCAIVTGGSNGIGKAIAGRLAQDGANVFLIARTRKFLESASQEVEREARSPSQQFGFFCADVSDRAAVRDAVGAAEAECGPVAVVVNSAGFHRMGYVEKVPVSDIEDEIRGNYLGTVYVVKEVIPGMIERREGWILNVSSLAGLKGIFGYAGYSGAKFAVMGLSEALRSELRPYGITVSALCPPDVAVEKLEHYVHREQPLENVRVSGRAKAVQPEEVARAAVAGMERGSSIIIPGSSGKLLHLANRLAPWAVDGFLNRTIDKARRERGL
jgi:3-dehydrosphinganine reductase